MINFFRKIRKKMLDENKSLKYLRYAVGEILLVVIGILIALQVNNWNIERKEYNQLKEYVVSLKQDLEKDIEMIKIIQRTAEQIELRIDSLSNYVRNREIEEISNLNLICLTWMHTYRPYSWNRATIEELKSSGSMRLFKNNTLSKKIVEYDTKTHHMDEDFNMDKVQSDTALKLLSEVVNNNYPNFSQLNEMIRVSIDAEAESGGYKDYEGQLRDVFLSDEYKEAETYKIPLNTNDKNVLINAVNNYIRIHYLFGIRIKIELPKLIDDAQEMIISLKEI